MASCYNSVCFFCTLCAFLALASLVQISLGIYFTFIQNDIITINHLIETDKFDLYPAYILLVFIGIGSISLILAHFSVHGIFKRNRSLSIFIAALWILPVVINLLMLVILFRYYYFTFPTIRDLLVHSLPQLSPSKIKQLRVFQMKHKCCGINNIDDYKNISLTLGPSAISSELTCSNYNNIYNNNGFNNAKSLLDIEGCYAVFDRYLTAEMWIIGCVICICAFLEILAITSMCLLNQRYQNLNEYKNSSIIKLDDTVLSNETINNNNNDNMQGSCKTIEDIIEVTQI